MPSPPGLAHRFHQTVGPWELWGATDIGLVRQRMEDAFVVLPRARLGTVEGNAWGVFDGLGGVPHGAEAAQAAADHLAEAMANSAGPPDVLATLNPHVLATRGTTTAVVAFAPASRSGGAVQLLAAGDSGIYELDSAGSVRLLIDKDSAGPHVVTDYLGRPGVVGHVATWRVRPGAALLLCSDGVDGVVPPQSLAALRKTRDPGSALEELFEEIRGLGAPDNATALLVKHGSA